MSKKPHKVSESATSYIPRKPTGNAANPKSVPADRKADDDAFKKIADKLFSERKELLHKLAQ